jgi:hypothetical protein
MADSPPASRAAMMPMAKDAFQSALGEGFHTAFRKGTDASEATRIHMLITEMDENAWDDVLGFVVWGLEVSFGLTWPAEQANHD